MNRTAGQLFSVLHRKQPLEELAIMLQRDPEILGGRLLAASPLLLEPRTRSGETRRELFDQIGHQTIRLLDALLGIVDEPRLNRVPTRPQSRELVLDEQCPLS